MKKVIVEINDKRHGPLDIEKPDLVYFEGLGFSLRELKDLGARITEVKEPLEWQGVINDYVLPPFITEEIQSLLEKGRRFHCKLVEIVDDES